MNKVLSIISPVQKIVEKTFFVGILLLWALSLADIAENTAKIAKIIIKFI